MSGLRLHSPTAISPSIAGNAWPSVPSDQQSKTSERSVGTIQRASKYRSSPGSARSLGSTSSARLQFRNENLVVRHNASHSSMRSSPDPTTSSSIRRSSKQASHRSSWGNDVPPPPPHEQRVSSQLVEAGPLGDIDTNVGCGEGLYNTLESASARDADDNTDRGLSFDVRKQETLSTPRLPRNASREETGPRSFKIATEHPIKSENPLKRLIDTLRPQGPKRRHSLTFRKERWTLDDFDEENPIESDMPRSTRLSGHQKASSWSSSGIRNAIKSATVRLQSKMDRPHTPLISRSHLLRSGRGSRLSNTASRASIDGDQVAARAEERAAWDRAVKRRRILEELISSEESYVADLKVLLHVYFFMLNSAPKGPQATQPEISQNVADMLRLHEDILLEMKTLMPNSHMQSDAAAQQRSKHPRWYSVESAEEPSGESPVIKARTANHSSQFGSHRDRTLVTMPGEAADVARVFERMLRRFFLYEEYGAKYESMLRNMAMLSKIIPNWSTYERGIEALVNSLFPQNGVLEGSKKGLTHEDLLIKPIQRVCRYPLLFADLHNHTPVIDGQQSSAEIEKVLFRLRETAKEINKATNDQQTQVKIQRSWHLQDLLVLPDTSPSPTSLRTMGHFSLCGVLYGAYQSNSGDLRGEYMLCALFKSHLLLALPQKSSNFSIVAIINTSDIQIVDVDNGRGLQCHTAPFSWKMMFEFDQQLYEMIFCGCTSREEQQWRNDLHERSRDSEIELKKGLLPTSGQAMLSLDIKTLGFVFGQPGTLTRRQSIQRAATVNSRRNGHQVIIKNTNSLKESGEPPAPETECLNRSQSLLSTHRIPVLAPKRAERQRIETAMSDIWTRDRLPFPGMTGNRGSYLIQRSATSVMRKISKASMTTTSTKRTVSTYMSITENDSTPCPELVNENPDSVNIEIQRRVSHASMSDPGLWPGHIKFHRITQTDGASSPPRDQQTPILPSQLEELTTARIGAFSTETTVEEGKLAQSQKARKSCMGSPASRGGTSQGSVELGRGKGKFRKPQTLLKAFSREGIKNWLN